MQKELGSKGFTIVGISLDKEAERAKYKRFVKDQKLDWVHIMDGGHWKAELAVKHGVRGIPALFLIDAKGVCVADDAMLESPDALDKAVAATMKKTPPTVTGGRAAGRGKKELDAAAKLAADKEYYRSVLAYEKIIRKHKGTPAAEQAQARIDALKKDKAIARAIAEQDAKINAPKQLQSARQLMDAGKPDEARKYLERVIKLYPGTEYAEEARGMLNKL